MLATMFVMGSRLSTDESTMCVIGSLLMVALLLLWAFKPGKQDGPVLELEDEVEKAIRLLQEPRLGAGKRWYNFKVTMQECQEPMAMRPPQIVDPMQRRGRA